jgi:hypothetical protein
VELSATKNVVSRSGTISEDYAEGLPRVRPSGMGLE